jgi:hypothetical protein
MTPAFATIETWTALSGLGRSKTYYLLADGTLRAIKAGKRTLIDVEHGMAWLRAQPAAEVRCNRSRKLAA